MKTIIAECYVTVEVDVEYHDDDGYMEVHDTYYATVYRILKNAEYWDQYGSRSLQLVNDFDFTFGCSGDYHLIVYSDGSKETKEYIDHD